jgi:hypothetical protein
MKTRTVALILVMLVGLASKAQAQSTAFTSVGAEDEEDLLAHEVDDPTVILTQLKL